MQIGDFSFFVHTKLFLGKEVVRVLTICLSPEARGTSEAEGVCIIAVDEAWLAKASPCLSAPRGRFQRV